LQYSKKEESGKELRKKKKGGSQQKISRSNMTSMRLPIIMGILPMQCWFNKDSKSENKEQEANVARRYFSSDSDTVMLMATTSDKESEPSLDTLILRLVVQTI